MDVTDKVQTRAPERTATAAELDAERAKLERARTGQYTRSLHAVCEQAVRLVPCGQCWAQPGRPCTITGPDGYHLARFARARRRGLLTEDEMGRVLGLLDVFTPATVIRDGAR